MDGPTDIIGELVGASAGSRGPLQSRTTSPTPAASKHVRRKTSFVRRADSSELSPSPHSSIYEAYYFSNNNSDNTNCFESFSMITLRDHNDLGSSDCQDMENRQPHNSTDDPAIDDSPFLYGRGTVLETITEQKSNTTMRSLTHAKSIENMPDFPFLGHRDSFSLSKSPRRRKSLSLDDLALINRSYHEACAMIERTARQPLPVHEIYAQPKTPLLAPLERPSTPPGMPSWTASQNLPPGAQLLAAIPSSKPTRFQRFFGIQPSESRVSGPSSNRVGRSASAPISGRTAPRFRPPRSSYTAISTHPFNNAPIAQPRLVPPRFSSVTASANSHLPMPSGKRKPVQHVHFNNSPAGESSMQTLHTALQSTSAPTPYQAHPENQTLREHVPASEMKNPIQCRHRKGRDAALKSLNGSINTERMTPPINEYIRLPSQSPSLQSSHQSSPTHRGSILTLPTQPNSISSQQSMQVDDVINNNSSSPAVSASSAARLVSNVLRAHLRWPHNSAQPDDPTHGSISNSLQNPNTDVNEDTKGATGQCWRCRMSNALEKMDKWWMQSAECFCWVCCAYDIGDDSELSHYASGANTSREMEGLRRVRMETPVIM